MYDVLLFLVCYFINCFQPHNGEDFDRLISIADGNLKSSGRPGSHKKSSAENKVNIKCHM